MHAHTHAHTHAYFLCSTKYLAKTNIINDLLFSSHFSQPRVRTNLNDKYSISPMWMFDPFHIQLWTAHITKTSKSQKIAMTPLADVCR